MRIVHVQFLLSLTDSRKAENDKIWQSRVRTPPPNAVMALGRYMKGRKVCPGAVTASEGHGSDDTQENLTSENRKQVEKIENLKQSSGSACHLSRPQSHIYEIRKFD